MRCNGEERPIGGPTLAEGIAVKTVGTLTLPIVRELVSGIVLVDEAQLEQAVNAYLTLQKTMAEGAGAAGLAAMFAEPDRFRGKKVGLILCGGNIDPRILASIMVRELERQQHIVSFRLTIPDRPGVLGVIATRLGTLGANILEVNHKRLFLDVPAKGARLDITVEARDRAHVEDILAALAGDGYHRSGSKRRRDGIAVPHPCESRGEMRSLPQPRPRWRRLVGRVIAPGWRATPAPALPAFRCGGCRAAESASTMALATAGMAPTQPASPAPLTPSGLVLVGTGLLFDLYRAQVVARGMA